MSEHGDPPVLISDVWQQRNQMRHADGGPDAAEGGRPEQPPAGLETKSDAEPSEVEAAPQPSEVELEVEAGRELVETLGTDHEPPAELLTSIEAELRTLRTETVHVNQILDRLHAENERLRRGEAEQLLMPLFRDLMKLADDWLVMGSSWERKATATPADVAQRCREVADDANLILARHGVEILVPAVGDAIERKKHRVVGTVEAETPELDNTVADVRRPGFVYGDRILKFAEVVVARHDR